ncbi:MAG: hypothetical protein ACLFPX_08185 [Candidatus Omnitrophota bacterium]
MRTHFLKQLGHDIWSRRNGWLHIFLAVVIATGIFFRVAEYLQNRSLWLDEVTVTQRVARCSVPEMIDQRNEDGCLLGYPIGFLAFEKFAANTWGAHELSLRLLALFAGCVSIYVMFLVARGIFSLPVSLAVTAVFSFSPSLIYYSSEIKPYMLDVLAALLILLVLYRLPSLPQSSKRPWLAVAAAFFICAFSFPALFVLAGAGLPAAAYYFFTRRRRAALQSLLFVIAGIAGFLIYCVFVLHSFEAESTMHSTWQAWFLSTENVRLLWRGLSLKMFYISPLALLILCVLGAVYGAAHDRKSLFMIAGVLIVSAVMSALKIYPLWDRWVLFLMPFFMLLMGKALDGLWGYRHPWFMCTGRLIAIGFMVLIFHRPLYVAWQQFRYPYGHEEIRPAMRVIKENGRPGDTIYVYYGAKKIFEYYAPRFHFTEDDYRVSPSSRDDRSAYIRDIAAAARGRVWFMGTHFYYDEHAFFMRQFLRHCREDGRVILRTCSDCPPGNLTLPIAGVLHLFQCER